MCECQMPWLQYWAVGSSSKFSCLMLQRCGEQHQLLSQCRGANVATRCLWTMDRRIRPVVIREIVATEANYSENGITILYLIQ